MTVALRVPEFANVHSRPCDGRWRRCRRRPRRPVARHAGSGFQLSRAEGKELRCVRQVDYASVAPNGGLPAAARGRGLRKRPAPNRAGTRGSRWRSAWTRARGLRHRQQRQWIRDGGNSAPCPEAPADDAALVARRGQVVQPDEVAARGAAARRRVASAVARQQECACQRRCRAVSGLFRGQQAPAGTLFVGAGPLSQIPRSRSW